ncbi:MAG TPA: PLD nuclease N-terminal domain-containing protein [Acidimicrobiales bacterium]|nr:PLD nuclease N-terminal domain-containing protein [Acidimicrobiales bacterium]
MVRVWGVLGLLGFLLWVYCIFDVIAADESLVRNLPKMTWLIIVAITNAVGAVAWLALGRPENLSFRPGSTDYRTPRRPIGPEDRPDFPTRGDEQTNRMRAWEEELERRERDLRRREEGGEGSSSGETS